MGNAVIGSLRANLGLDSSKFQKGARGVKDPLKAMRRQFLAVSAAAVAFGGAITGAALLGAKQIDDLAKASRRLDASIGGFRAVQLAADEAGISLSSLTNDVQTMNRELSRAGEGGPVDDALRQLGLSAEELLALDVDGRLALIADRMVELGLSSGQATAILQDFGVRNREMALLMIQGGDAIRATRADIRDYGLELSKVDSERIERANDQISRLSIISERFGQRLALRVVPALGKMAEAFTNSMREGGLLRKMIDGFADNLKRLATYIGTFVTLLGVRLVGAMAAAAIATGGFSAALITLKGAMLRTGLGGLAVLIGEVVYRLGEGSGATSDYQAATEAATAAENNLAAAMGGVSAQMPGAAQQAVTLAGARVTLAKANLEAAKAELQHQLAMKQSSEESVPFLAGLVSGVRDVVIGNAENTLRDRISELDDAQSGLDRVLSTVINADYGGAGAGVQPVNEQRAALENLILAIDPVNAKLAQYDEAVTNLDAALSQGLIDQTQYNHYLALAEERLNGVAAAGGGAARSMNAVENATRAAGNAAEEANTAADGLASTFASTFTEIFSGTKSAIGALADLAGQLGKMALMAGFKALFGGALGGLSGGGAGLASLFGFNANGTEDWQGGMSLVGERGPELVNLPTGSKVFNAQKSAQMLSAAPQAAAAPNVNVKSINLFDMSLVGEYMAGPEGEAIYLNHMARNNG